MFLELLTKIKKKFEKPFEIIWKDDKTIQIICNKNIELIFKGDFEISIDGNVNIISNDFYLDTLADENGSKLYLNSRLAKQIKDKDYAIEYRKHVKEYKKKMKLISDELTKTAHHINHLEVENTHLHKLSNIVPKEIE